MKDWVRPYLLGSAGRSRPAQSVRTTAIRWAAVAGYLILAVGIPLPAGPHIDVSQPFPCMHHRCGCHSVEQCWRNCCCMSLTEKLAWARENEVTPPDHVLAEAQARGIPWNASGSAEQQVARHESAAKQCCCCKSACCPTVPQEADCCQAESKKPAARQEASRRPQGVVLIEALACRGADSNWMGASISLLPPAEVSWSPASGIIERIETFSERYCGMSIPPSTPPPRLPVA